MKELTINKITNSPFVNQVKIEFTSKSILTWGGFVVLMGKFLEKIEEDNLILDSMALTCYVTQLIL